MTASTDGPTEQPSDAVVDAMRALLWVQTSADARRATEQLVRELGGTVVSARTRDAGGLPADVSFGDGEPLVASAPVGSEARARLDTHLVPFLLDAPEGTAAERTGRTAR